MKAIRKTKVTYAILFLAALVLFLAVKPGTVTYAASKKNALKNYKTITAEKSQKIKGMVYSMEKNGDGYTVIAAKNGDRKTILSYCDSPAVTTNGKYLYYATGEFQTMSNYPIYSNVEIYQYNINTRKQKKIMSRYLPPEDFHAKFMPSRMEQHLQAISCRLNPHISMRCLMRL